MMDAVTCGGPWKTGSVFAIGSTEGGAEGVVGASTRLARFVRCRRNNTVAIATAINATTTAAMPILVAAVRDRLSSASACSTAGATMSSAFATSLSSGSNK